MDPNRTLEAIRRIIRVRDFPEWADEYGEELAENIEALDHWLTKQEQGGLEGFLPDDWSRTA